MKKEKQSVKIIPSPFILFGLIFMVVMCFGILIFIYSYPVARNQLNLLHHIACIFFSAILPILAIICMIYRGFLSVITIDNSGLKISVLGIFRTKKIAWEEMSEICYYERLRPFVFFSKTGSIQGMYYDQIIKKKDAIQVELTPKVYRAIKRFTKQPILNLTEDRIKLLRLEKEK